MSERSATSAADRIERLDASARVLIERASRAEGHVRGALDAAIAELFLAPDQRFDDRVRAAIGILLDRMIDHAATAIAGRATAAITARGRDLLADALDDTAGLTTRLADAGLLRDSDLMAECLTRVRLELIVADLPVQASGRGDVPSLLVRLANSTDRAVASAASALLAGENARRAGTPDGDVLPDGLHARVLWWVAAALRERAPLAGEDPLPLDRALAEAVLAEIAALPDRVEDVAMQLVRAIDAQADELPVLLEEALGDRRLILFSALIAHALGISYVLSRDVVVDPAADRLSLVLRGLELPRDAIARLGSRLCEGDYRRDIDGFAETLDIVARLDPAVVRRAVAPIRLHPDYRAARAALGLGTRA